VRPEKVMKAFLSFLLGAALLAPQQPPATLYDEARVPTYVLPDPLILNSGERVPDAKTWVERRRPEILEMYRTEVFGRAPAKAPHLAFRVDSTALSPYGVPHQYQKVALPFADAAGAPRAYMVVYLPAAAKKPVPVFLGLSFAPVQTVYADPAVPLLDQWVLDPVTKGVVRKASEESSRGAAAGRWQLETILQHGYGLATIYYGDIEPDFVGGMNHGIRALFLTPGQAAPMPDEWGAISAWAWVLSRAMDFLETDRLVDAKRVAVIGHSRLGKTALWAGAQDPRFSIVISNESGEGGAAISRRLFGERTRNLNTAFPHWFCGNFKKYNDREDQMPFDAHFLLSLIAPRALYVASAEEDLWSDPRGEFLAAVNAGLVYGLLGRKGLGTGTFPALNQSIGNTVRYHVRAGKHDVTAYDWEQYLRFADEHWR
jgi:hypothetical protein